MAIDDPYANLLVHGTLPLVSDPGSPTGLRFAEIGIDRPEDCIRDAAGLPQVDISLHVFADPRERDGYARALADFGDNAISFLPSARSAVAPPIGLVVRHDRERHLSGSLDDAIRLVGAPPKLTERFSKKRRHDLDTVRRLSEAEQWEMRWRRELSFIKAIPGYVLMGDGGDEDGIDFITGNDSYRIVRHPEGLSLVWRSLPEPWRGVVPEDHAEAGEALGLLRRDDGFYATRPGEMTRETIETSVAAFKELKRIMMETAPPIVPEVWKYGRQR